jgi:mating pheromone alpha-factor
VGNVDGLLPPLSIDQCWRLLTVLIEYTLMYTYSLLSCVLRDYKCFLLDTLRITINNFDNLSQSFGQSRHWSSVTNSLRSVNMKFTAIIAATILACTVSSAAIPAPQDSTSVKVDKRGKGWTTKPYRPIGLPLVGKREAEAEAEAQKGWTTKPYRPIGLPLVGREAEPEAEAQKGWTTKPYRPIGLPLVGKREAEAEAQKGWTTKPYRPIGLPLVGKREMEAESEAEVEVEAEVEAEADDE